MANELIKKSFKPNKKELNYLSKDFTQYKDNLIQFAKTYFPNTFKDFSDSSPGLLFIEQAAAVGDILSFYVDNQLNESLIQFSQERKNILAIARALGYKPRISSPGLTTLEVFQIIPSIQSETGEYLPDYTYALNILQNMQVTNADGSVVYRTIDPISFSVNTNENPTDISVYNRDSNGIPVFFLLRKTVKATAGTIVIRDISVGDAEEFFRINLPENNVIEILEVRDSDNNIWYEVESLAQDLIFVDRQNVNSNDQRFVEFNNTTPVLIQALRTSRRFTTNVLPDNTTYIEFGPGLEAFDDEIVTPSLDTVGRGLLNSNNINTSYDPSNFLKSTSFGKAPQNTTLTVKYVVGGGIESNINTGELTTISTVEYSENLDEFNIDEQQLISTIRSSLSVNNIEPGVGGRDAESNEEIRQNALAYFSAQNRTVTREDYIVRALSMPSKYGSIAKVFVNQDGQLDLQSQLALLGIQDTQNASSIIPAGTVFPETANTPVGDVNNPYAINMYVLGFNNFKKLTTVNNSIKENLRTYLDRYRLLTDAINILDGFIINIGVDFEIVTFKNENKKDVLANCILSVSDFFNIDNFSFNQPINLSALELEIAKVEGVQSVNSVKISNLTIRNGDYSPFEYNIERATRNKIIYPSLDPSVFEVKFPTRDIKGRVV